MQIFFNGEKSETASSTIIDLLAEKGFDVDGLIVEQNFMIVKKADWYKTSIKADDKIECVTFIGGG